MADLYTIQSTSKPTIAEAAAELDVAESSLDASFGIVAIDPVNHLYVVRTNGAPASVSLDHGTAGPFANPQVVTFGPPR